MTSIARASVLLSILSLVAAAGCDEDQRVFYQAELPPEGEADADAVADADFSFNWDQDFPPVTPPVGPWNQCPDPPQDDEAYVVQAFELADQYYGPEDLRTIEAAVEFPPPGNWAAIHLELVLGCPADNQCDHWDRYAAIDVVDGAGTEDEQLLELERYITPYNVGMCFVADVTPYATWLQGTKTIRSHIDTWVGPDNRDHGHGWRVTLRFLFHPGAAPGPAPREVRNVWRTGYLEIGNPDNPIEYQAAPATVTIPEWATRVELRTVSTGHGQGNARNCAEFCQLTHGIAVNDQVFEHQPWRADCGDNPLGPWQMGTWQYPRNGWCPGAYRPPALHDITAAVTPGEDASFDYSVYDVFGEIYVNSCRPGAGDEDDRCAGCAFSNEPGNCDYNGSNHTTPVEKLSVQLFLYD